MNNIKTSFCLSANQLKYLLMIYDFTILSFKEEEVFPDAQKFGVSGVSGLMIKDSKLKFFGPLEEWKLILDVFGWILIRPGDGVDSRDGVG